MGAASLPDASPAHRLGSVLGTGSHSHMPTQAPPAQPLARALTGGSGVWEGSSSWLKAVLKALKVWLFCLCFEMVASMTWSRQGTGLSGAHSVLCAHVP